MAADKQPRRPFEPPPWEREAFERFEKERAERQARQELDDALRQIREPSAHQAAEPGPGPEPVLAPTPAAGDHAASAAVPRPSTDPAIDERRVSAMFVELKMQEPPAVRVSMSLVYAVIAFLVAAGLIVIVQAVVLFSRARASEAAGMMLAATMSLVVFFAGLGFIAGAVLLFRKYHR